MEPRYIKKNAIKIIGMNCQTNLSDNKVPELWQAFLPRMTEVKNRTDEKVGIGICICSEDFDIKEFKEDTEFTEIAGVEVNNFHEIPSGMITHTIQPSNYAVFTHKGSVFEMKKTYDYIYGVWVPANKVRLKKSDTFEWYDERFAGPENPDSECDIYIPIE